MRGFGFFLVAALWGSPVCAGPPGLILPTENDGLYSGRSSSFYMYTDRTFEGVRSKPWTGGKFGYVRNQKRTSGGIVFTRFHEGVDIAPVRRDSAGRALDKVRAISAGRVVHTSLESGRSSYGRYVVIEHNWGGGPFYSLYGHLQTIGVKKGELVQRGAELGQMGCTGWAGNRDIARSHLHLELNMLLHDEFPRWHDRYFKTPNHHGNLNGLNLAGIDIAGLLVAQRADPTLTVASFIGRMSPYFRVAVPLAGSDLQLRQRYPWLSAGGGGASGAASWEITFSRSGVPLRVEPSARRVSAATVTWVQPSKQLHSYATRGRLGGMGSKATLTDSGKRYLELVSGRF